MNIIGNFDNSSSIISGSDFERFTMTPLKAQSSKLNFHRKRFSPGATFAIIFKQFGLSSRMILRSTVPKKVYSYFKNKEFLTWGC